MTSLDRTGPIRIAMWSGPRNISTAMMRSFGGRADCAVTDEPFYGAFLKTTGIRQPMAGEIIASMDCDWKSVANAMRGAVPGNKEIWYQKHMPHHMAGDISIADFPDHHHAFLIRDPARVVASYAAKRVTVTPDDLGYKRQLEYAKHIAESTGKTPIVLDSNDILHDPEAHLKALCFALQIPWDARMLSWKTGRRDTDGIWGSHWYNRVVDTTSFGSAEGNQVELDRDQNEVAARCRPFYDQLLAYRLKSI